MDFPSDGLTLDQLAIFVAVVDHGSFSAAAQRLRRAQSAITYGVQNLELQVGTQLFDRSTYRASLTASGMALLPYARRVLDTAVGFRNQARSLVAGVEPRLRLALDVAVPKSQVIAALVQFRAAFPTVEVICQIQPLEETFETLRSGEADLAVIVESAALGPMQMLERRRLGVFDMIAVAARHHPLAALPSPITREVLFGHMQLLLSAGRAASGTTDLSTFAANRWRLNDLSLRREFLLAGLGWGSMPDFMVADDLSTGRLIALPVDTTDAELLRPTLPFSLAWPKTKVLGPSARWLVDRICHEAGSASP